MEEKVKIESLIIHLRNYFETKLSLLMLNASDKASGIISSIVSSVLIAVSLVFVLLFLSIGTAIWIGSMYNDFSKGFLFVGLFYLLVAFILFAFRRSLIKIPVINSLLNTMHDDKKD